MTAETQDPIRRVTVLGAGTMGHGIAQIAAKTGYDVALYDLTPEIVARGMERIRATLDAGIAKGKTTTEERDGVLARIRPTADLPDAVADADLVVEAAPETIDLKREIFAKLSAICRPDAILATNTSSLQVSKIAGAASNPERVLGMHFFNPPHIMKLVEIVRAAGTSNGTVETAVGAARRMGKETIVVRDSPGFATSRLGMALGLEAMRMLEEGVASAEEIDRAMELGYGHAMGPLRVSDLIGLDVRLAIAGILHRELGSEHFRAPEILRRMVREGRLGIKTGEGFYKWPAKK